MSTSKYEQTELGANVRRLRDEKGYTHARLALASGAGPTAISSIERGQVTNPGVYTLYPLALALGVSMETLMGVTPIAERGRVRHDNAARNRRTLAGIEALVSEWEGSGDSTARAFAQRLRTVLAANGNAPAR